MAALSLAAGAALPGSALAGGGMAGWRYHLPVTVASSKVSSTESLIDFPLLVAPSPFLQKLRDTTHGGGVESDRGYDIVFTSPAGGVLSHEVERYDPTTGELIAWVKVPMLSNAVDTTVVLHFGNSAITTSQEQRGDVWSSGFRAVWHLDESASPVADSTTGASWGTATPGVAFGGPGRIGSAVSFDGGVIDAGGGLQLSSFTALTLSAWVRVYDLSRDNPLLGKANGNCGDGFFLRVDLEDFVQLGILDNNCNRADSPIGAVSDAGWHYLAGTWSSSDAGASGIYVDGEPKFKRFNGDKFPTSLASAGVFTLGGAGGEVASPAVIDEARVAAVSRSAGWMATEYANQSNPSDFVGLGQLVTARPVYFSVGQNTANHLTGVAEVSLDGGVAKFTVPQTQPNLGVGDVVDYDGDNKKAYLVSMINSSTWRVVTSSGDAPSNLGPVTVNSITHAYASLADAFSTSSGTSIADRIATKDLVASGYVVNVPCYYDSGPDTKEATIGEGWTTGPDNYVRVYTPVDTAAECNQSQRHDGRWRDTRFRMLLSDNPRWTLKIAARQTRLDGLQLEHPLTTNYNVAVVDATHLDPGEVQVSNTLIRWLGTTGNGIHGLALNSASNAGQHSTFRVWNNVIYGFGTPGSSAIDFGADPQDVAYVYNNTVYTHTGDATTRGIASYKGTLLAKNNLVAGPGTNYEGSFDAGSDGNLSEDDTAPGPTRAVTKSVIRFVDSGAGDFHLAWTDVAAIGKGLDLTEDPNLVASPDFEGDARPAGQPWDIGADQSTDAGAAGDAGLPPDAGLPGDAGGSGDAGTMADAGPIQDGGSPDGGTSDGGGLPYSGAPSISYHALSCGCSETGVGASSALPLAALLRRRRGRR